MRGLLLVIAMVAFVVPGAALADAADGFSSGRELAPYLQCVPYARERSGVQIYGDARTWWDQAAGRYERGQQPRPGAVMAFRPTGTMVLGHVATVSRVIDSRTVLLDHANWSPIDGRRGQIERGVKAIDVSPANDWSQVRVWYAPLQDLGTSAWPVAGFIYNERETNAPFDRNSVVATASYPVPARAASPAHSRAFASAFASIGEPVAAKRPGREVQTPRRAGPPPEAKPRDAIEAALARYGG
ncbi:CHAP domain-containing protein [Tsuneonella sp. HG249]